VRRPLSPLRIEAPPGPTALMRSPARPRFPLDPAQGRGCCPRPTLLRCFVIRGNWRVRPAGKPEDSNLRGIAPSSASSGCVYLIPPLPQDLGWWWSIPNVPEIGRHSNPRPRFAGVGGFSAGALGSTCFDSGSGAFGGSANLDCCSAISGSSSVKLAGLKLQRTRVLWYSIFTALTRVRLRMRSLPGKDRDWLH